MKRLVFFLMSVALSLVLSGCSNSQTATQSHDKQSNRPISIGSFKAPQVPVSFSQRPDSKFFENNGPAPLPLQQSNR